jgi:hypothetical protein
MEMGVFSLWSVLRSYLEDNWGNPVSCQLRGSAVREAVKKELVAKVLS